MAAQMKGFSASAALNHRHTAGQPLNLQQYPRQKMKRRICSGSRPHKPRATLQLDRAPVTASPADVHEVAAGNPIQSGAVNRTGLNGLSQYGTVGLSTGTFHVSAVQPINYIIEEVEGLLDPNNKTLLRGVVPDSFPSRLSLDPCQPGERRLVVIDDNVFRIYGAQLREYFNVNGVEATIVPLPTMEANKSFDLVHEIARQAEAFKLNRRKEPIIAIGGGVCLDVTGLLANLYRRNTPVIKVPTTLMAAIDASIGIKTAVNFENRKNKLGTYCPPLGVFIDRTFLRTLDQRNISNGAAEMLKMACVKDAPLFHLLEQNAEQLRATSFQDKVASVAMRRSIQGMLEELEPNLWEHILCRLVDYGHTFSPEIEMAALAHGDELLHGEAVNIDMALTTQMSYARGLITAEEHSRVIGIMQRFRLPMWHPVCGPDLFLKGLKDTTKARDGLQRVPLMCGIGCAVFVNDISPAEIYDAAAALQNFAMHCSHSIAANSNIVAAPAKLAVPV